jgi:hypothetical protein
MEAASLYYQGPHGRVTVENRRCRSLNGGECNGDITPTMTFAPRRVVRPPVIYACFGYQMPNFLPFPSVIGSACPARPTLIAALMLFLCTAGCMRRDGRNSDCRWPSETITHSATGQHLSEDTEFAEDLAIRYADVHYGLRTPYYVSGEAYVAARNRCMAALFQQIAEEHGVPIDRVYSSLAPSLILARTCPSHCSIFLLQQPLPV